MITAVTGFTRCGTTLCMRMLHAGGLPAYADNLVSFESDKVDRLPDDATWLAECDGRAVKLVEPLQRLPLPSRDWRFILMRRDPAEQAASQIKFLTLLGYPVAEVMRAPLTAMLRQDYPRMRSVLRSLGPVLVVTFEDLLDDPLREAERLATFLGQPLALDRMVAQVIPRSPACYPGLLETAILEESRADV